MSRSPQLFRQRDVARAVRGVTSAGLTVHSVEVDRDGRIIIRTSPHAAGLNAPAEQPPEHNEWDDA